MGTKQNYGVGNAALQFKPDDTVQVNDNNGNIVTSSLAAEFRPYYTTCTILRLTNEVTYLND